MYETKQKSHVMTEVALWAEYANNLVQLIISGNIIIQAERKDALLNSVKKVDFFLYLVKASKTQYDSLTLSLTLIYQSQSKTKNKTKTICKNYQY